MSRLSAAWLFADAGWGGGGRERVPGNFVDPHVCTRALLPIPRKAHLRLASLLKETTDLGQRRTYNHIRSPSDTILIMNLMFAEANSLRRECSKGGRGGTKF